MVVLLDLPALLAREEWVVDEKAEKMEKGA
jgi:hypothetical protein